MKIILTIVHHPIVNTHIHIYNQSYAVYVIVVAAV